MPRPTYVYLCVCMNYRSADEWYSVGASSNPLQDVKRIRNAAVATYASRRVLWVVESQHAADVAQAVNEWLCDKHIEATGGCYKLGYADIEVVKTKAKELAKIF